MEGSPFRRVLLIALLLCAVLGAQSSSIAAGEETHHGSQHCCGLCHLGPAPLLPTATVAMVPPAFSAVWLTNSSSTSAPREFAVSSSASRAPPVHV